MDIRGGIFVTAAVYLADLFQILALPACSVLANTPEQCINLSIDKGSKYTVKKLF